MYNLQEARKQNFETYDKIHNNYPAQIDVYTTFVKDFRLNKAILSPFREEKNPSFCFYLSKNGSENIYWKDFGTGERGNWVDFLKKIANVDTFKEAIAYYEQYAEIPNKKTFYAPRFRPSKNEIQVKRRPFSKEDIEFWAKYGISQKTLIDYKVSPILYYTFNGVVEKRMDKDELRYCYKIFNHFKIYRPYAKKIDKWRSNTNIFDIQGFEQLVFDDDVLIVTKALKDVMCLRELGYDAIAPQSESTLIPTNIIQHLQSKYKKIYILYDNDRPGIEGSKRLAGTIANAKEIRIPASTGAKDISDLIKITDMTTARLCLTTLLTHNDTITNEESCRDNSRDSEGMGD